MPGLPVKNNKRFNNLFPTTQKKRIGLPTDKTSVPLAISRTFLPKATVQPQHCPCKKRILADAKPINNLKR
jgi:hypothetical protein